MTTIELLSLCLMRIYEPELSVVDNGVVVDTEATVARQPHITRMLEIEIYFHDIL